MKPSAQFHAQNFWQLMMEMGNQLDMAAVREEHIAEQAKKIADLEKQVADAAAKPPAQ